MKINEYIKTFYEKNDHIRPLPWIICRDGFRMSVQVGRGMNSIPEHIISDEEWGNGKRYVCVECGALNAEEEALKPYAEDPKNLLETIYAYVPANLVDVIIKIHGGMMNEEEKQMGYQDYPCFKCDHGGEREKRIECRRKCTEFVAWKLSMQAIRQKKKEDKNKFYSETTLKCYRRKAMKQKYVRKR